MAKRPPGAKSPASEPARPDAETAEASEAAERIRPARARDDEADELVRRHLAFGWWSITLFTALGLLLEAGHGLKLGWYLDVSNAIDIGTGLTEISCVETWATARTQPEANDKATVLFRYDVAKKQWFAVSGGTDGVCNGKVKVPADIAKQLKNC